MGNDEARRFDRLRTEARPALGGDLPDTFVQWKGTDLCADFWCVCGAVGHVDESFCYVLACPACGRRFEVAPVLCLREMTGDDEREGPVVTIALDEND